MDAQNDSLRDLQAVLVRQLKKLHDAMDDVTNSDQADAIVREMQEVNHRIALVGGLLFASQSKKLETKVAAVRKATQQVAAAISDLKNLQGFLDTLSDFLGLVDEAIDLAKTLV